jgi:hypothetical protein
MTRLNVLKALQQIDFEDNTISDEVNTSTTRPTADTPHAISELAYDVAYRKTMERIESQEPESKAYGTNSLMIVSCSRRPLSSEELLWALAIEPDGNDVSEEDVQDIEDVVSVCAGLLTVDNENKLVRLVHKSAQEYLTRHRDQRFPSAHASRARICLIFAGKAEAALPWTVAPPTSLINYGLANRFHYYQAAEQKEKQPQPYRPGRQGTVLGLTSSDDVAKWGLVQLASAVTNPETLIIDACHQKNVGLVELLIKVHKYDVNSHAVPLETEISFDGMMFRSQESGHEFLLSTVRDTGSSISES